MSSALAYLRSDVQVIVRLLERQLQDGCLGVSERSVRWAPYLIPAHSHTFVLRLWHRRGCHAAAGIRHGTGFANISLCGVHLLNGVRGLERMEPSKCHAAFKRSEEEVIQPEATAGGRPRRQRGALREHKHPGLPHAVSACLSKLQSCLSHMERLCNMHQGGGDQRNRASR